MAGSWLMASVYMVRTMANSSTISPVCGINSLQSAPHLPFFVNLNTDGATGKVAWPDDIPVNRILALLVDRMNLPLNSPDGQIMSYKLHHRRTGRQLLVYGGYDLNTEFGSSHRWSPAAPMRLYQR